MKMTTEDPVWVTLDVVMAIHEEQLAEHGGPVGIRDQTLLESALGKPLNLLAFGESPDICALAASYAFGLARNHPFVDGNKRTAFVVCELFLALNGLELIASDADCVLKMLALAAGEIDEEAFAAWLRSAVEEA